MIIGGLENRVTEFMEMRETPFYGKRPLLHISVAG